MLTVSVIIPVRNGGAAFECCLHSLLNSQSTPLEFIVVDDQSSDDSSAAALAAGATLLQSPAHVGPAAARNLGAAHASGDLLFFFDADVRIRPDTLEQIRARFESDPNLDALFGSYDDDPPAQGLVSQYKNLLHHYVHQHGQTEAATFWSGCGAIKAEVFRACGGFDERYIRPSIEDIELGYRLNAAGRRIVLDPCIQVTHLKQWTLGAMLRSDILFRALPWTRVILQSGRISNDLNLTVPQRASALLLLASLALLVAAALAKTPFWAASLPFLMVLGLNRSFYGFLASRRGWFFVASILPLHLSYYMYSTIAFAAGVTLHWASSWRPMKAAHPVPESRECPADREG